MVHEQIEFITMVIQAIGIIPVAIAAIIYLAQLFSMRESHIQSLIIQRRELYFKTTSLTEEELDTMLLHLADHFDLTIYFQRYKGNRQRIKSYFLMKRKYLYLVIVIFYRKSRLDPVGSAPGIWLNELCSYQEFRDVHASQSKYYPRFAKRVDKILNRRAGLEPKWALDAENDFASGFGDEVDK